MQAEEKRGHSPLDSISIAEGYRIADGYPDPERYLLLRKLTGLTPRNYEQAVQALEGSWFGVYVVHIASNDIVGMGRVIGDGGWYFHIADIAVHPDHQKKGLGNAILKGLLVEIEEEAPPGPYVNLVADGPGKKLYAAHGFTETAPRSVAMEKRYPVPLDKAAKG